MSKTRLDYLIDIFIILCLIFLVISFFTNGIIFWILAIIGILMAVLAVIGVAIKLIIIIKNVVRHINNA